MDQRPWFANYPKEVQPKQDVPPVPLTHYLKEAVKLYPSHTAVSFFGGKMSYRELLQEAYRFANALSHLGVGRGDRVALMLPNLPQYVICYYGTLLLGAVVVQTNPLYVERELVYHLNDSGADTIVCLDLLFPRIRSIRDKVKLKRVIVTAIPDYLPFPKNILYPIAQKRKGVNPVEINDQKEQIFRLKPLLRQSSAEPIPAFQVNVLEDVAVLQYTGGTTGTAKGVMLTHYNLVANVEQAKQWMYRAALGKETVLAAVPMFHVYGMTVCLNFAMAVGGKLVLLPRFEIDTLLKTIHAEKPTIFPGAPTMYIAINHHPQTAKKFDISSIQCCISGSAPLPLEVQQRFQSLSGGRLVEGYGLSECSPVTHANPIWERSKIGSIGLPWPGTDCRIADPDTGAILPVGEVGEMEIKGPQVMKGYWNRPEETAEVLRDGWLRTGDMGYMDEDGYFYIVDRKKDLIIAGGYKIFPRELEEVLFDHPSVLEATVIGVPDDYRGETVKAYVVLKPELTVTEEELNTYCRSKLAAYKVPRYYEFREELPKSMVGKVLRRVLQEQHRQGSGE
ncbi:long-chain-fatty-acid--CoA ligase [Paenibacillus koleovorans]|uniref:long-chain-fatty-acid--CoA ligase n=1 Tax=Paenibacillus koleovorans TaxID=121608 RepID=UPI000FD810A9|nr:long-chain fatty acid--CoA ligase [Paenibacillus koleovorans]